MAGSLFYWAGTESSFDDFAGACLAFARMDPAAYAASAEADSPSLFELQGNVGVIHISGSLTNRQSWWDSKYGLTSYTNIRNAAIEAAIDPDVEEIVLHVHSGGGDALGVSDLGKLLARVGQIKPLTAFTDGAMGSAAYWLGSSASEIYASDTAIVGSIGIMAVHMDLTKMLADMGVKPTVFRAGEFKALAGPYEKLTDPAKAQMQQRLDSLEGVFVQQVADRRGHTVEYTRKHMAEGREFVGAEAKDVGLVDGITTFDDLMTKIQSRIEAKQASSSNYREGHMAVKRPKALTEQAIAALAEGATQEQAEALAAETTETPAAETPAPAAEAPAEPPAALEMVAAELVAGEDRLVAHLQAELATAQENLVQAKADLVLAKRDLSAAQAAQAPLAEIVGQRIHSMQIAMRQGTTDCSKLSAESLVALFTTTQEAFHAAFPVGGKAQSRAPEEPAKAKAEPMTAAQRQAVKF